MIELDKRYLIEKMRYDDTVRFSWPVLPSLYFPILEEIQVIEISSDNKYAKIKCEINKEIQWILIKDLKIKSELKSFSKEEYQEIKDKFCEQYKGK